MYAKNGHLKLACHVSRRCLIRMSYLGVHLFLALLKMVLQIERDTGLWIQI